MILRVGLTGGIASGKSTVMRLLNELGCITSDADALVAELYEPGAAGHRALVDTYGTAILTRDGRIDRKRLADVAFARPDEARKLNALIHPIVIAEQERRLAEAEASGIDAIFVIEATLLIESGGRARYDRIVIVDVAPEVQLARGIARGMTEDEVRRRMANQMRREERLRHADYVIDNSGDPEDCARETQRVFELLRRDLEAKKMRPEPEPGAAQNDERTAG